jgi:hypothetical protein
LPLLRFQSRDHSCLPCWYFPFLRLMLRFRDLGSPGVRSRLPATPYPASARYERTRRNPGRAATSLGRPPVGTQPRPQQGPKAFDRVDMDLMESMAIVITGVLPSGMTHRVMRVIPFGHPAIDVVFIRVKNRAISNRLLDQRTDRYLLHVLRHPDHDLAGPLDHPEDRRLLLLQCPPARLALQPSAASESPFFLTASGWPLCPATT